MQPVENSSSGMSRLAGSARLEGPAFLVPDNQPSSMAEYIRELVRLNPGGEYVEIDRAGETHRACYADVLSRAEALAAMLASRMFADSLIIGCHTSGTKIPIFWVFQAFSELEALAGSLGPDQPLYGMRSCVEILEVREYFSDALESVIDRYLWELMPLIGDRPFVLAGNCQGGILSLALARRLQQLGRCPELLMLLEWNYSLGRYADRVLLLYGEHSDTAKRYAGEIPGGADPQTDFPNHVQQPIGGTHAEYFREENVGDLASAIVQHLPERSAAITTGENRARPAIDPPAQSTAD